MKTVYKMITETMRPHIEHSVDLPEDVAMFLHLSGEKFYSIQHEPDTVTRSCYVVDIKLWFEWILEHELDVSTIRELDLNSGQEVDGITEFDEIPVDYSYESIGEILEQIEKNDLLEEKRRNHFMEMLKIA